MTQTKKDKLIFGIYTFGVNTVIKT